MVNWTEVIRDLPEVEDFARGELSGRELYSTAIDWANMETRSAVRNLLRNRGVEESRRLARKALRRRGVKV